MVGNRACWIFFILLGLNGSCAVLSKSCIGEAGSGDQSPFPAFADPCIISPAACSRSPLTPSPPTLPLPPPLSIPIESLTPWRGKRSNSETNLCLVGCTSWL